MRRRHTALAAAAAAASFALTGAGGLPTAAAQDADSDRAAAQDLDEVIEVVEEADQVRVTGARVAAEGLLVGQGDRIELTYWVSYADLEPAREADARELEQRIGAAAEHICERLAEMYPAGAPDLEACVREAFEQAFARLNEAPEAAGGEEARR